MTLVSPDEHTMLVFWVDLVVLAVAARGLGVLVRRFGQPSVVGELLAGLALGPSVLGNVAPGVESWLFPGTALQSGLIVVVATVGVVMMLIYTGFETDLALIRSLGRATLFVAGCSVLLPLAVGVGAGAVLPSSFVGAQDRTLFLLYVGAAVAISSLPVIAKVLSDLHLTRRNFAQVILAAGMANDVVGWLLLGALAGVATSDSFQPLDVALTVGAMLAFLAGMLTVGQRGIDLLLRWARASDRGPAAPFTMTLLVGFGAGALTQLIGVEAVLGAFVAGIALGRSKFQDSRVPEYLNVATMTLFAPVFFATAGLRVDLGALGSPSVLVWTLALIVVASAGKFSGAFLGGRLAGFPAKESLAVGIGLNTGGALQIVIATIGLTLHVLNTQSYTAIVVMAIVTSVLAPPLLRAIARRWAGTEEEQRRLELEETHASNVLVQPGRLLLPVQPGDCSIVAAKVMDFAWPEGPDAVVLSVSKEGEAAADNAVRAFTRRDADHEHLDADDPVVAIVEQVQLGFDIVGIGAWQQRTEERLLSPLAEALLAQSCVPTVVAWDGRDGRAHAERGFRKILVPVVSTVASRAGQEVAFSLAATTGASVVITHVDVDKPVPVAAGDRGSTNGAVRRERARESVATGVVDEAADLARRLGISAETAIVKGRSRAESISELACESGADLVVLGAELQPVAGETFFGHLVERLIRAVDSSVVVVAMPRAALGMSNEAYPNGSA